MQSSQLLLVVTLLQSPIPIAIAIPIPLPMANYSCPSHHAHTLRKKGKNESTGKKEFHKFHLIALQIYEDVDVVRQTFIFGR